MHAEASQGLLRRDEKLMKAAQNDVGQFIAVLMDAGRLGLEPGTEQYYLVPRWNNKKKCTEVTGVRGYQGEIELMYRAGAISSVIVEAVYSNDQFQFRPGRDERPLHDIDWDAEDRGTLRLVYAYAVMKDGAEVTDEELREFLAPSFAKWWLPDRFEFVEEIPKTAVGKFRKTALREQFASAQPAETT